MRISVAVLAAAAGPCAAFGQTASFKCPAPGTVVENVDGSRSTWLGPGPGYCQVRSGGKDGDEITYAWYAPSVLIRESLADTFARQVKPASLWPLAAGRKLTGRYDGAGHNAGVQGSWLQNVVVEGFERVTVPAGTFDAFVVARSEESLSSTYKSTLRQWWAPEPGVTVKFLFTDNQGARRSSEASVVRRP